MKKTILGVGSIAVVLYTACGGPPPKQADTAGDKTDKPAATSDDKPAAKPDADKPAASASASADTPAKRTGPSRPAPTYEETTTPTTVGVDGAVFRTQGAELRIPFGWNGESRNILFALDKKARGTAGKIGVIFEVHIQMPETEYRIGVDSPSMPVQTNSDPFVIKLPLPKGTKSANLAIETITADPKTKANKSTWAVIAMTKLETSDAGDRAVFEMNTLPDGRVHLTSSGPSGQ